MYELDSAWDEFSGNGSTPWVLLSKDHVRELKSRKISPRYAQKFHIMASQTGEPMSSPEQGDDFVAQLLEAKDAGFHISLMGAISRQNLGLPWQDLIPAVRAGLSTKGEVRYLAAHFPVGQWARVCESFRGSQEDCDRFIGRWSHTKIWDRSCLLLRNSDSFRDLAERDSFLYDGVNALISYNYTSVNPMRMQHILASWMYFYHNLGMSNESFRVKQLMEDFKKSVGDFS